MRVSLDLPVWLLYPYLFVVGAIVGSFANVCIYRIPTKRSLWDQLTSLWERPSQCPRCRNNIPWYDNIPIFGWLKLRGRCRNCKMRISPRYALIELLSACLWVLVYHLEIPVGMNRELSESILATALGPEHYPGLGWMSPELFLHVRYLYHMVLIEALLVASFIDFDLRIIPDAATVPAMTVGILASAALGRVHLLPVWFQSPNLRRSFELIFPQWVGPWLDGPAVPQWITAHPHLHGLAVSLAGLIVGGGLVWLVRLLGFWLLRQEAMGFGDVILMGMIGSFLGWQATVMAFFIAPVCALAVVVVTRSAALFRRAPLDRYIPYGPYLSLGALLAVLCWKPLFARFSIYFSMGVLLLPVFVLMVVLFTATLALVQGTKRLLGLSGGPPETEAVWTAGDQNWFFAGETVNRHTGRWKTPDWDGCAAARGSVHEERWRGAASPSSEWPRAWLRRK